MLGRIFTRHLLDHVGDAWRRQIGFLVARKGAEQCVEHHDTRFRRRLVVFGFGGQSDVVFEDCIPVPGVFGEAEVETKKFDTYSTEPKRDNRRAGDQNASTEIEAETTFCTFGFRHDKFWCYIGDLRLVIDRKGPNACNDDNESGRPIASDFLVVGDLSTPKLHCLVEFYGFSGRFEKLPPLFFCVLQKRSHFVAELADVLEFFVVCGDGIPSLFGGLTGVGGGFCSLLYGGLKRLLEVGRGRGQVPFGDSCLCMSKKKGPQFVICDGMVQLFIHVKKRCPLIDVRRCKFERSRRYNFIDLEIVRNKQKIFNRIKLREDIFTFVLKFGQDGGDNISKSRTSSPSMECVPKCNPSFFLNFNGFSFVLVGEFEELSGWVFEILGGRFEHCLTSLYLQNNRSNYDAFFTVLASVDSARSFEIIRTHLTLNTNQPITQTMVAT